LAAAALHWGAFYIPFIRGELEGAPYRLGIESGVLHVHTTAHASAATPCLTVFRNALISGTVELFM